MRQTHAKTSSRSLGALAAAGIVVEITLRRENGEVGLRDGRTCHWGIETKLRKSDKSQQLSASSTAAQKLTWKAFLVRVPNETFPSNISAPPNAFRMRAVPV